MLSSFTNLKEILRTGFEFLLVLIIIYLLFQQGCHKTDPVAITPRSTDLKNTRIWVDDTVTVFQHGAIQRPIKGKAKFSRPLPGTIVKNDVTSTQHLFSSLWDPSSDNPKSLYPKETFTDPWNNYAVEVNDSTISLEHTSTDTLLQTVDWQKKESRFVIHTALSDTTRQVQGTGNLYLSVPVPRFTSLLVQGEAFYYDRVVHPAYYLGLGRTSGRFSAALLLGKELKTEPWSSIPFRGQLRASYDLIKFYP